MVSLNKSVRNAGDSKSSQLKYAVSQVENRKNVDELFVIFKAKRTYVSDLNKEQIRFDFQKPENGG